MGSEHAIDVLTAAAEQLFQAHPAAAIVTSLPGAGALTGARLLAEIGDDPERFADARALKAYAGAAPITRASGRTHYVGVRCDFARYMAYFWQAV